MRPRALLVYLIGALFLIALVGALLPLIGPPMPEINTVVMVLLGVVGVLAAVDAIGAFRLPELTISRVLPEHFSVGRSHNIGLRVVPKNLHAVTRPLPVWVYDFFPAGWETDSREVSEMLRPDTGMELYYQARPTERGDAVFSGCQYAMVSPLGLWWRIRKLPVSDTVKVLPDFSRILGAELMGIQHWLSMMGAKRIQRRGEGQDFHQLRAYQDGDSIRHVDWKATSRMQAPIVRTFHDERDQQVVFLLDCGRQMRTAVEDGLTHFDHALNAMLLLAYTALKHEDGVGLLTFAHPDARFLPPHKGLAQLGRLVDRVYDVQPCASAADYEQAVSRLMLQQQRRALVVVISHFDHDNDAQLTAQLARLKKRHAVLFASIRQAEQDVWQRTPLKTRDDSMRYVGLQLYRQHEANALRQLAAMNILNMNVLPKELSAALINQYLRLKRNGPW